MARPRLSATSQNTRWAWDRKRAMAGPFMPGDMTGPAMSSSAC